MAAIWNVSTVSIVFNRCIETQSARREKEGRFASWRRLIEFLGCDPLALLVAGCLVTGRLLKYLTGQDLC